MPKTGVQNKAARKFDRNRKVYEDNDTRILNVIQSKQGLRIGQISTEVGLGRRIVRQHLWKLQDRDKVTRVGFAYYLAGASSAELNESVKRRIHEGPVVEWNVHFDRNVAGCYTFVDPAKRLHVFDDLFERRVNEFLDGGFWLDEILLYMMIYGLVSRRVCSHGTIDKQLLRKGWDRCFGNTRLLVFAYAINPSRFLDYLLTPRGTSWAMRILRGEKWVSILKQASELRVSKIKRLALQEIRDDKRKEP